MALYTYITDSCISDAQKFNLEDDVKKYAKKIESDQSLGSVDLYPRPFIKRNVRRQGRLIIEERRIDDNIVYCFLKVFKRSDEDYKTFMKQSHAGTLTDYVGRYIPPDEDVRASLESKVEEADSTMRPYVSVTEHTYLNCVSNRSEIAEESIIESRTWVERMGEEKRKPFRVRYGDLLEQLVFNKHLDPSQTSAHLESHPQYKILFRYFPNKGIWFLIAPLELEAQEKDEEELRNQYTTILEPDDDTIDMLLRKEGLRSYPTLITVQSNLWLSTQESTEANLALSPEEMDVLNSVLKPTGQAQAKKEMYPLFINGRPGSGKSTILLYLFAEHLHFHLNQIWQKKNYPDTSVVEEPPLYLTYSESLLNDAQRIVQTILRCDSEKAQSRYDLEDEHIKQTIDQSFGHFRTFLRNRLPRTIQDQFSPHKYVDFSRFQRILRERLAHQDRTEIRTLSPEIAWHVIRTYIKGMRQEADEYIDSDFYEHEVPRKQQSVSLDTFRMVYEHAWKNIYLPLCNEGYWDDQDLARQLLDLDDARDIDLARRIAIFCDESQDFTKLELELVFRLSLFARRNIKQDQLQEILHRIPFAFAGDPFQTLNPTGFDWNATKSIFHDNIIRPLDPGEQGKLSMNVKELEYNYRSARPIVQFCNLIQLIRGRTFGDKSLKPQKTWQSLNALKPMYFDIARPICQQELADSEAALIIIVPCQEGEEETYVKNDPFLSRIAWNAEKKTVTRDILSPMRAKGLQFKRIVLYKFGAHALSAFADQLQWFFDPPEDTISRDATLPLEYFINHLYVAVSRPRGQLIIVDSEEAFARFWTFASKTHLGTLLSSFQPEESWSLEDITHIIPGTQEVWRENLDDARQLGHDFFQMGKAKSDPYFMERARRNYLIAGMSASATEALAMKFVFEEQPAEAGREFVKLNRIDEALTHFWKAAAYEDIRQLARGHSHIAESLQGRIAIYMVATEPRIEQSARLLFAIQRHVRSREDHMEDTSSVAIYTEVLDRIIHHLAEVAPQKAGTLLEELSSWHNIWRSLSTIAHAGIDIQPSRDLARLAFEAEEFVASRTILEDCKIKLRGGPEWMIQVLIKSSTYPETLRTLQQLELYDTLVETYEQHKKAPIDEAYKPVVFEAYLRIRAFERAIAFLDTYPSEQAFFDLLQALGTEADVSMASNVARQLLDFYVIAEQWEKVVDCAGYMATHLSDSGIAYPFPPPRMAPEAIHGHLIRNLARSETLSKERSRSQRKKVARYLRQLLVPPSVALADHVHPFEAGAAFERSGEYRDTQVFYEAVIKHAREVNQELQQWAELRWIKNKLNLAKLYNNKLERTQVIQSARSKMAGLKLTEGDTSQIPELPDLTALDKASRYRNGFGVDPEVEVPSIDDEIDSTQEQVQNPDPVPVAPPKKAEIETGIVSETPNNGQTAPAGNPEPNSESKPIETEPVTEPDPGLIMPIEPRIQAVPSPTIITPSKARYAHQRPSDVPIAVSIMLQVGDMAFDCELLEKLRVLDVREQHSKTRVAVLAERQEVRDSYEKLHIVPRANGNPALKRSWLVQDWSMEIGIENRGPVATISLIHTVSNYTMLNLQI